MMRVKILLGQIVLILEVFSMFPRTAIFIPDRKMICHTDLFSFTDKEISRPKIANPPSVTRLLWPLNQIRQLMRPLQENILYGLFQNQKIMQRPMNMPV